MLATNTPDVVTEATADLTWALLLAAARRVTEGDRFLRARRPWIWGPEFFLGFEVHGRTLGVIGLGRIGRAVVRRAAGFAMPVVYTARRRLDPGEEAALGVAWRELDELLAEADFVTVHTGLSPATRYLIGAGQLARMKPTAVLVNTARGPIVDEAALVAALRAGELGAAGLDVFEREPEVHPGLLELDNVAIVPHLGTATLATRVAMGMAAADNLLAALEGRRPRTCSTPRRWLSARGDAARRPGRPRPARRRPPRPPRRGAPAGTGAGGCGARRSRPAGTGVLEPPGQDHVPVDPAPPQAEGGEAHPHLEGDAGLLRQDRDRAVALGQLDQPLEDGHHLGVAAGQVALQVEGRSCAAGCGWRTTARSAGRSTAAPGSRRGGRPEARVTRIQPIWSPAVAKACCSTRWGPSGDGEAAHPVPVLGRQGLDEPLTQRRHGQILGVPGR